MVRKIRIAFLVALAGYLLAYFGISNYVSSTVNLDPESKCSGDLACVQVNIARTLAVDMTLYSLIAAGVLGGLAFVVIPAGKKSATSGQRTAPPTAKRLIQSETQTAKKVAQPTAAHPGMKCSRCGTDNPAANKFCVECGQSMVPPLPSKMQCTRCGADNLAASKFCVECGQSMVPPPPAKMQCTRCGADNLAANKFCVECGQSMEAPPPAKKQCAHCGATNEPAYSFCTDCGTSLSMPQVEPEPQEGSSPSVSPDEVLQPTMPQSPN